MTSFNTETGQYFTEDTSGPQEADLHTDPEPEPCCYKLPRCTGPSEKYKSGQPICWNCWYDVKLNMPAARHWAPAAMHFLSNVDMYDKTSYFAQAGLTQDEWVAMLKAADKLLVYSDSLLYTTPIDELSPEDKTARRAEYLTKNGI